MAKSIYICSNCNGEFSRWFGKCPNCGLFSSLEEHTSKEENTKATSAGLKNSGALAPSKKALTISELKHRPIVRISTGIQELDRVLGGGLVDSEVILFAGHPGAGKSTLSLRIADKLAATGKKVLYSSGEESENQIALRANRMGVNNDLIRITNETNLETLLGHLAEEKPDLLIVDSLQTLASTEVSGSIGSLSQSKEAAHTLTRIAKRDGIMMLLINQIVKSGEFAGSEAAQHIVDCSIMLESDNDSPLKFLRASKNRFGDTNEIGVFQHTENGLEEVLDPSGVFMDEEYSGNTEGTSCSFVSEGVRQIPVEVQALATKSNLPTPRKQFNGVNFNRGQIVCAILDKFCATKLYEKDVFLSTVSGVKVIDPQSDLSVAASILSSVKDKSFGGRKAFVGELTLTGNVRGSFMVEQKIKEAERLGFDSIVLPANAKKMLSKKKYSIELIFVSSVKELANLLKG